MHVHVGVGASACVYVCVLCVCAHVFTSPPPPIPEARIHPTHYTGLTILFGQLRTLTQKSSPQKRTLIMSVTHLQMLGHLTQPRSCMLSDQQLQLNYRSMGEQFIEVECSVVLGRFLLEKKYLYMVVVYNLIRFIELVSILD